MKYYFFQSYLHFKSKFPFAVCTTTRNIIKENIRITVFTWINQTEAYFMTAIFNINLGNAPIQV